MQARCAQFARFEVVGRTQARCDSRGVFIAAAVEHALRIFERRQRALRAFGQSHDARVLRAGDRTRKGRDDDDDRCDGCHGASQLVEAAARAAPPLRGRRARVPRAARTGPPIRAGVSTRATRRARDRRRPQQPSRFPSRLAVATRRWFRSDARGSPTLSEDGAGAAATTWPACDTSVGALVRGPEADPRSASECVRSVRLRRIWRYQRASRPRPNPPPPPPDRCSCGFASFTVKRRPSNSC